jgi:hypothetical protein
MRDEVLAFRGGLWSPAKPLRDTSWWHQKKRELACDGHDWQPEPDSLVFAWFCSKCAKETEGAPRTRAPR